MIPLVTWNLRVSARACGSVLSWSRTLCGSLAKAASVGAKIVKGVADVAKVPAKPDSFKSLTSVVKLPLCCK